MRHTAALQEAVAGAEAEVADLYARLDILEQERESLRRELDQLNARADESERLSQQLIEVRAQNAALEEALREKSEHVDPAGTDEANVE